MKTKNCKTAFREVAEVQITFLIQVLTVNKNCKNCKCCPAGMDAPPSGEGGSPPRPARKNDQIRGEVAGQNKGHILKSFQKRKVMMEQYCNTE